MLPLLFEGLKRWGEQWGEQNVSTHALLRLPSISLILVWKCSLLMAGFYKHDAAGM
jgi:hypothetical protein